MHDYSSVNITQTFASEDKTRSLSVQFIAAIQMFSVTDAATNQLWENASMDETALFIDNYLSANLLPVSSWIFQGFSFAQYWAYQEVDPGNEIHFLRLKLRLKRKSLIFMKLENIKELLQIICNFNNSNITHTFAVKGSDETLTVICIQETFILEITSNEQEITKHFTSIDEAAEFINEKIHVLDDNWLLLIGRFFVFFF